MVLDLPYPLTEIAFSVTLPPGILIFSPVVYSGLSSSGVDPSMV